MKTRFNAKSVINKIKENISDDNKEKDSKNWDKKIIINKKNYANNSVIILIIIN